MPKSKGRRPANKGTQRRPAGRPGGDRSQSQSKGQPDKRSLSLSKGRPSKGQPAKNEPYEALPPPGALYTQILRGETYTWWRSALGVILGLCLFLVMTTVVRQLVVFIGWAAAPKEQEFNAFFSAAMGFEFPLGMLAANLAIFSAIPISWLVMALVHQVKPRWLSSVRPRLRWRYLLLCLGVAAVALNAVVLLSVWLGPAVHFQPQPGFWGFLVVIILTSPLQAAAEEYFFRGYLMQAFGSVVRQPWFGVLASSLVFAAFHGSQNLPLFIDRFAFGLVAALLVLKTGGLEAGIAAHVINNICAYTMAGLTSSIAAVSQVKTLGWADAAFDVGGFALFAVLAWLLARQLKMQQSVTYGRRQS